MCLWIREDVCTWTEPVSIQMKTYVSKTYLALGNISILLRKMNLITFIMQNYLNLIGKIEFQKK